MRVLLVPAGSHGDVHPFVAIGKALKARGHEVHLITAPPFAHLAADAGFDDFAPLGTADDFHAMTHDPDLWKPARSLRAIFGRPERFARHLRDAHRHIADRYRPGETVVAAGLLAFGARVAHDALGVPFATVHLQPSVLPSVEEPPVFPSVRMRTWWPRWFRRSLYWVGDRWMIDPMTLPTLNAFRRELGLPPIRRMLGVWSHSPQLIVGLFPEWFGNAPDWPPRMRLTGFVRYDQAELVPVPVAVEAFLAAGEPPVVVTFGSAMRQGKPYFAAAVEACRLLGKRALLLARGAEQIPADLPPGVLHAEYAPFSKVFPRAAAVVHHGGIGTCRQTLAAGVPQLIMPLAFDQPDNADRLRRLGVAAEVWPKRFTGPRVAAVLRALLDSPAVAVRCRELAGRVNESDPVAESCTLIESLAGRDVRTGAGPVVREG